MKKFDKKTQKKSTHEMIEEIDNFASIWENTKLEIQEEKFDSIITKIIKSEELDSWNKQNCIMKIWGNTIEEIQQEKFNSIITKIIESEEINTRDKQKYIRNIWNATNPETQKGNVNHIFEMIEYTEDKEGDKRRNDKTIREFFEVTDPNAVLVLLKNMNKEKLKENFATICIKLSENLELSKYLSNALNKVGIKDDIDIKKFIEILKMKDSSFLKQSIIKEIFSDPINNCNGERINKKINKIHNIFLTNDLPEVFKTFYFFKCHKNYEKTNEYFYKEKTIEERDKIIIGDLFDIALESNNRQLEDFLELFNEGHNEYIKKKNGYQLEESEEAILFAYNNALVNLYEMYGKEFGNKDKDSYKNIEKLKKMLHIDEKSNIGDVLLSQFIEETKINKGKYLGDKDSLSENFLEYIDKVRQKAIQKNSKPVDIDKILEEGDLIKGVSGFSGEYLDSHLKGGIKSREFYMIGSEKSDTTPLDTDFSQISSKNIKGNSSIRDKLKTTYTGESFGETYYVIKKKEYEEDYGKDKSWTIFEGTSTQVRCLRTGIGSSKIDYIITSEWEDDYNYIMAQNGIYIPVIDLNSEKVIFTYEQYQAVREKMKGMSFYRADNFEVDETAFNSNILALAQDMKQTAVNKISTVKKRQKLIELIKSNLPGMIIADSLVGDLSDNIVELIDIGSTGRGTNIPGDGNFDFILRCSDEKTQNQIIARLKEVLPGVDKSGIDRLNIRYKDVQIKGLEESLEVDVTPEIKNLQLEYSSDMCVRDILDNIRKNYGEEIANQVIDNILVAKKKLKEIGTYKKNNISSTNLGGLRGIGIENWILQNGGSFILAMQTFLDNSIDKDGNKIEFNEFTKKYPIYDFGQNHINKIRSGGHDCYINELTEEGYYKLRESFVDILNEFGIDYQYEEKRPITSIESEKEKKEEFFKSIIGDTKERTKKCRTSVLEMIISKFKTRVEKSDLERKISVVR